MAGVAGDLRGVRAAEDPGRRPRVHREHLEDAAAASVAALPAPGAAAAPAGLPPGEFRDAQRRRFRRGDRGGLGAAGTDRAHQPLREHADQGGADQEAGHSQVGEPGHGRGGVVRVERREHQVAGQRRLHRHLRGFRVPDLPHHQDVRVLAQDAPDGGGEGELDPVVDLHLAQGGLDQLDRVLDGDHIHLRGRHLPEDRVERGRLAAPGGAGDQDEPLPAAEHRPQAGVFVLRQAEFFQRGDQRRGVEDPEDRLLPEDRRQRRDPQFDLFLRFDPLEPAVLGPALFGDVQAAEHLDPADDGAIDDPGEGVHGAEHAVHPEADDRAVALGFDVDVGGAVLEGLAQDGIQRRDHRAGGGFEVAGGVGFRDEVPVGDLLPAALVFEFGLGGPERGPEVVEAAVHALDVRPGGDDDFHLDPEVPLEVVYGASLVGVRHGDGERSPLPGERADGVAAGEGRRQRAGDHLGVQLHRVDRPERQAGVLGDRLCDVLLGDDPLGQERLLVGFGRQRPDAVEGGLRLGGDPPFPPEEVEEAGNRRGAGCGAHRGAPPSVKPRRRAGRRAVRSMNPENGIRG